MHPLPTAIRFFRIIFGTSLEHGKLRIPKDFIRKYGGDLSNPMFLKPPDGTEWEVFWTKHDGDSWLQKGWKEFATYYSLDHGHMVVFEYKETSHFEVHIFDKTTLEIEYPFHGSQDEQDNLEQPCHNTRQKSPMSCPEPRKKLRTGTSGDVKRRSTVQNLPQHVQIKCKQSQGTNFKKSKVASVKKELDEDMGDRGTTECIEVEPLTSKITEAVQKAVAFRSTNPCFILVMKPSHVGKYRLNVPSNFSRAHFKRKQGNILLQVLNGRTWPCKYNLGNISGGWNKFVSDNNLNVGDVCLFEHTKSPKFSLKVLIFPVAEEPHSPPVQGGKASQRSERSGTLKEANRFTSENPFFTVKISPVNVPVRLNLAANYVCI